MFQESLKNYIDVRYESLEASKLVNLFLTKISKKQLKDLVLQHQSVLEENQHKLWLLLQLNRILIELDAEEEALELTQKIRKLIKHIPYNPLRDRT